MPSFDIVSEVDLHEVTNAVDQANREVGTRFDFKGSAARYELQGRDIRLSAESDFQLQQMVDISKVKLAKRGIDLGCLAMEPPETLGRQARQTIRLKQGIDANTAS